MQLAEIARRLEQLEQLEPEHYTSEGLLDYRASMRRRLDELRLEIEIAARRAAEERTLSS